MRSNIDPSDMKDLEVSGYGQGGRDLPVVLIVDDDEDIRDECSDIFTSKGIRNITAKNADDALAKLRANRSILALLADIHMPGKSGFDLMQQIHADFDELCAVETVIMSAYVGTVLGQHPAGSFAVGMLTKPASRDEIWNMVLKAAKKTAGRRAAAARKIHEFR